MALSPIVTAGRFGLVALFAVGPVAVVASTLARGRGGWGVEATSPPEACFDDACLSRKARQITPGSLRSPEVA